MLARRAQFALLFALALGAAACSKPSPHLTVGARTSTEQQIVAEIVAQHLEHRLAGTSVVRRFGLTSSRLAHEALLNGEVDVYPEYSGTALTGLFGLEAAGTPEAMLAQVRENYRLQHRCEWFGPLGFDNGFRLVILKEMAESRKVRTLSQAEAYAPGWALATQAAFQEQADGLPLLMRRYRLHLSAPLRSVRAAQVYTSLSQSQATMVAGNATDVALDNADYVQLADDRKAFPPAEAGLVVKVGTLESTAGLADALRALNGRFRMGAVRAMVRRIEVEHATLETTAAGFLKGNGL